MCVTDWNTTWARPIECSRRWSKRAGAADPASIALLLGRLGVGGILSDPPAGTQIRGFRSPDPRSRSGRGRAPAAAKDDTRIVLRPIGSALPLGFFAFGIGMLLLGASAIGWIPVDEQKDVGMFLIAFVFPLELVATVVAFLARDTLGATTLGLFTTSGSRSAGPTTRLRPARRASPPASTSSASRRRCSCSRSCRRSASRSSRCSCCSPARGWCSPAAGEVGGSHGWYKAAGCIAIALAALAFYGGTGLALEDARKAEWLPLFRRGKADEAFSGYEAQLEALHAEPGVRQQL